MSKNEKAIEPMDPTATEKPVGEAAPNNTRACYALATLVDEVQELFPETPVEYSNYDGRNTALDVTFDLTGVDEGGTLWSLLGLLVADRRIRSVIHEEDSVLVGMVSSPRTQDSREPFGLADALEVLSDDDGWEFPGLPAEGGSL